MSMFRSLHTVLDEMRECCKTSNYSYLMSLIEEAQHMSNKMESKLDKRGHKKWKGKNKIRRLKTRIRELESAQLKHINDVERREYNDTVA